MMDEVLIELVRENTVLYDLSHAKYMDTKYKNNLWTKIGTQMNVDDKSKFTYLQCYCKEERLDFCLCV